MNKNIPWLEKYRPKKIKDIVSQEEITNILNNIVLTKEMPHLLFYGSPGIGKTTAILALCRELYGIDKFYDNRKILFDICGNIINKDKYLFIDILSTRCFSPSV